MKKVGFLYDDIFLKHENPPGHPEAPQRLIKIVETLKNAPFWNNLVHIKPRRAEQEDILRVHTKDYYENIKTFSGFYDSDTYVSPHSFEAALFAAGAVIEAIEKCNTGYIERAFCAVRPPGHHAEIDRAMGFCIFNNVAVGVRYAEKIGFKKVFIVDFDVHHGNGTQHIFEGDGSVYYFSTHQYPHYPGTGRKEEKGTHKGLGYTCNIPLKQGSDDRDYTKIYNETLPPLVKTFDPDIIIVSAGYDIHIRDPLSDIRVSDEGIRNIVRGILSCTSVTGRLRLPCVFALEGGYNLNALSGSVLITVSEMLENTS